VLVASLALPWYAGSVDGWEGLRHARWLIVVSGAVGLAALLLQALERAPAVPVTLTLFAGLLGLGTTIWLIYRVLINPPGGDRLVGGFVALASAAAISYAAWRSMRLEGIAPEDSPSDIPVVELSRTPERPT
jgi:hypothetical protein